MINVGPVFSLCQLRKNLPLDSCVEMLVFFQHTKLFSKRVKFPKFEFLGQYPLLASCTQPLLLAISLQPHFLPHGWRKYSGQERRQWELQMNRTFYMGHERPKAYMPHVREIHLSILHGMEIGQTFYKAAIVWRCHGGYAVSLSLWGLDHPNLLSHTSSLLGCNLSFFSYEKFSTRMNIFFIPCQGSKMKKSWCLKPGKNGGEKWERGWGYLLALSVWCVEDPVVLSSTQITLLCASHTGPFEPYSG